MRVDPSKHIPTTSDNAEVWIEWHKALKKWFSKGEANSYFVRFWNQRAGENSEANTTDLRRYMKEQDVNITTTAGGKVADFWSGVGDWFGSLGKILLFGLAALVTAFVGVYAYRKIKSA